LLEPQAALGLAHEAADELIVRGMRCAPDQADDLTTGVFDVVLPLLFGPELIGQVFDATVGFANEGELLPLEIRSRDPSARPSDIWLKRRARSAPSAVRVTLIAAGTS
jgi:hypothetical protein